MMTEKLYELDSYCKVFAATVLECKPHGDGYAVRLDRTAFSRRVADKPLTWDS